MYLRGVNSENHLKQKAQYNDLIPTNIKSDSFLAAVNGGGELFDNEYSMSIQAILK